MVLKELKFYSSTIGRFWVSSYSSCGGGDAERTDF